MKLRNILVNVIAMSALMPVASASTYSPIYSPVVSPQLPKSMKICNQEISFDPINNAERLDRELTSLAFGHSNTLLMIKRANRYFPVMAPILKENGIPTDLLYLACIESTLNPRAVSSAKAAGIWQFMPGTAREYGLEVNDEVDERFDVVKSTEAACRYFKKALASFNGDWTAVFESFNGGMGRISGQLKEQLTDDPLDLYLTEETQRYPFRIMAAKLIMENPQAYGFKIKKDQLYTPRQVDVIQVSTPVASWAQWAREHGISYLTLRDENPWIRSSSLTNKSGKTYNVRVPKKSSLLKSTAHQAIYNNSWTTK